MDPISAILINRALDGLTARAQATADNIANANSKDFHPLRVTFEEALRAAVPHGADAIAQVKPHVEEDPTRPTGGEPRLDMELATASETSARYAALLDLMGRQMMISRIAIRGGQ